MYRRHSSFWSLVSAMDNLNAHSEYADQPQGQEANGLPSAVPTSQVLDSDMNMFGQHYTNLLPFPFSLEQDRPQLDQALQLHNEQVQLQLLQEMSVQNQALVNLVQYLHIELQRNQQDREIALHDRLQWMDFALGLYGINQTLIRGFPPVQQVTNSHVASNEADAPAYEDEASSMVRIAVETAQPGPIHLCACKSCGVRLMTCPVCGAVNGDGSEP